MNVDISREELKALHPVTKRLVVFPTPASEYLFAQCELTVSRARKGLAVTADPYSGLTTALRLIEEGWSLLHGDVPVVSIRVPTMKQPGMHPFWAVFFNKLQQPGQSLVERNEDRIRLKLVRKLVTLALSVEADRVLLLIDQAHHLTDVTLSQICSLQDEVGDEEVHLVVVLAGHWSMLDLKGNLQGNYAYEPLHRFFENEVMFESMKSSQDLSYFFESFDSTTYPDASDWTYSRFFLPEAFDRGWRLWHEAPNAWAAFQQMAVNEGDGLKVRVAHVQAAVCNVLETAFSAGPGALPPNQDSWKSAIAASGFLQSQQLLNRRSSPSGKP